MDYDNLHFFPVGYSTLDVKYKWLDVETPVKKYKDIQMAQFQLADIHASNQTWIENHGM